MFEILTVNGKEYKLRLTMRGVVELESKFKKNIVAVVANSDDISFTDICAIFWAMLIKYNANITYTDAVDIVDDYLCEGHSLEDLMGVIANTLKVSGFIKEEATEEEAKN